ncbi:hypothetical protein MTO96_021167 [Rhipicephalus appendiculatus]
MLGAVPLASDSNVQLRFLAPDDAPEVRRLCTDWFPIEYPDSWYHDITSNPRFFALAAMYGGSHHWPHCCRKQGAVPVQPRRRGAPGRKLPARCTGCLHSHPGGCPVLAVRECRRNGIATLLLDSLLAHLSQQQPQSGACKAVYLHVLASNTCAIQFYERRRFRPHAFLPLYYSVRGTPRDGYSYVLYINGGHPPWTLLYPCLALVVSQAPCYNSANVQHWSQKVSRLEVCALPKQLLRMVGKLFSRLFSRVFVSHK